MPTIDELWASMRKKGVAGQQRISADHRCDLYADFSPPDQVGLVAVCDDRPPLPRAMRAITVERGERADGRCSLRLALAHRALLPVFSALCQDIIGSTTTDADQESLGRTVLDRLQHWRALLERDSAGLDDQTLRGLIGELFVLQSRLIPTMDVGEAVRAWRGPFGAPQDFLFRDGDRWEVKAVNHDDDLVTINGLAQLDSGADPLTLVVVRVRATGSSAEGSVTAPGIIVQLRARLETHGEAISMFDSALAQMGWHEHSAHDDVALHIVGMEAYPVGEGFPRLTSKTVPTGVDEAIYSVSLRGQMFVSWPVTA